MWFGLEGWDEPVGVGECDCLDAAVYVHLGECALEVACDCFGADAELSCDFGGGEADGEALEHLYNCVSRTSRVSPGLAPVSHGQWFAGEEAADACRARPGRRAGRVVVGADQGPRAVYINSGLFREDVGSESGRFRSSQRTRPSIWECDVGSRNRGFYGRSKLSCCSSLWDRALPVRTALRWATSPSALPLQPGASQCRFPAGYPPAAWF